jgi:hypothetical protein
MRSTVYGKRRPDASGRFCKIASKQHRWHPKYAISEATEVAVSARIRRAPQFMRPIINLNKTCDPPLSQSTVG